MNPSSAAPVRADHPLQGIAWMVAGVFLLSVMDALSKHAVSQLSIPVLIGKYDCLLYASLSKPSFFVSKTLIVHPC
jgi:hypothetical protein